MLVCQFHKNLGKVLNTNNKNHFIEEITTQGEIIIKEGIIHITVKDIQGNHIKRVGEEREEGIKLNI